MDFEISSILNSNICLSGGAVGSDLQWGMNAGKIGHSVIHWSFRGHKSQAPEVELVRLTEVQLKCADVDLIGVSSLIKRPFPTKSMYVNNLIRRNWYQICDASSCYAVSSIKDNMVVGGTGWAVALFLKKHNFNPCPIFVYDQKLDNWFTWTGDKWAVSSVTIPRGIWAGIGTRDLKENGKTAIRTLMGLSNSELLYPIVNEPKIGDIIYVPDNKEPGRGIDDILGGWATVQNIQSNGKHTYVSVTELSCKFFCWDDIVMQQSILRDTLRMKRAELKPDEDPNNNYKTERYRLKHTTV